MSDSPEIPSHADLKIAHQVLVDLIAYIDNPPRHLSLGQEGYTGLQLAESVVQDFLNGMWR